ncbi:hypothetical protein MEQU1_001473 [Malassezia equina]|uniref:Complex 1 LYR protein domain-containing protein n=1 Tax=Malassezia equina TaxID=1381935 RepID=A0AAF0EDT2_9BASI|nr:hypothetical protein MEQU1_001473 [Malassezia equina]
MSAAAPTREQIMALYRAHLATARAFNSYNFRQYFERRTRDSFRAHLYPGTSEASQSMTESVEKLSNVPTSTSGVAPAPEKPSLADFYKDKRAELKVLQRAAVVNQLYAGDRLVVEDPSMRDWIVRSSDQIGTEKDV